MNLISLIFAFPLPFLNELEPFYSDLLPNGLCIDASFAGLPYKVVYPMLPCPFISPSAIELCDPGIN